MLIYLSTDVADLRQQTPAAATLLLLRGKLRVHGDVHVTLTGDGS